MTENRLIVKTSDRTGDLPLEKPYELKPPQDLGMFSRPTDDEILESFYDLRDYD
jgi:hypothetical protein